MTNVMAGLTRRHRRSHRPGMMSLVSSSGEVADPLPAAARAPSATVGYRGGAVQKQTRPAHPSVARESRSAYKERPAGQAGRVLTIALCEDGQFIPREAVYVHNQ